MKMQKIILILGKILIYFIYKLNNNLYLIVKNSLETCWRIVGNGGVSSNHLSAKNHILDDFSSNGMTTDIFKKDAINLDITGQVFNTTSFLFAQLCFKFIYRLDSKLISIWRWRFLLEI